MSKLTPIILIVFSVIIFFTFIDPQREEINILRAEKAEYNEVLEKAKDLLKQRDELQAKYRSVPPEDLENLKLMLPDNIDNVKLALDMDQLAKKNRISIKNIAINDGKGGASAGSNEGSTPAPADGFGGIGIATINFSVSTTYDNFLQFLRELEDSLRIIDITNLSVAPSADGNYNYTLTLRTYWLK